MTNNIVSLATSQALLLQAQAELATDLLIMNTIPTINVDQYAASVAVSVQKITTVNIDNGIVSSIDVLANQCLAKSSEALTCIQQSA